MSATAAPIQIFIGTKAQYIKTAPVIHELEHRDVCYRLIDSGQHGAFSEELRHELGIRRPDFRFGDTRDVTSIGAAIAWSLRVLSYVFDRRRLKQEVFPEGRICIVHGDTPSTFLAALLARRAGLDVAHLEAGLRSFSYLSPFPEELIRVLVMKMSTLLFAPSPDALENLQAMRLKGEIVPVAGNTIIESIGIEDTMAQDGVPVVTLHRVENLHRRRRLVTLIELVKRIASDRRLLFVVHPPTRKALAKQGLDEMLKHPNIETRPLLPHNEFLGVIRRAPFVITDGGSIQEECAALGIPTLLWRDHTERGDGLGENVVLSRFDPHIIERFLADPGKHRRHPHDLSVRPSVQIVDRLLRAAPMAEGPPGVMKP